MALLMPCVPENAAKVRASASLRHSAGNVLYGMERYFRIGDAVEEDQCAVQPTVELLNRTADLRCNL